MTSETGTRSVGSGGMTTMRYGKLHPDADPQVSFAGKTVLIIGGTAGVGLEAALKFANLGADRLIIGARNVETAEKAKKVKEQILEAASNSKMTVDLLEIDMLSPSSIKSFCDQVDKAYTVVDAALINAGVAAASFQLSDLGWEKSIQVEVLGKALCSILLLPKLIASGKTTGRNSVLTITGSEGYLDLEDDQLPQDGTPILDWANKKENFDLEKQYRLCKLEIMFIQDGLVEALKGVPNAPIVVVNSPGMTTTSLGRDFGYVYRGLMWLMHQYVARTAEQGSRALVSASTLGEEANGGFWFQDQVDGRMSALGNTDWKKRQKQEFARVIDVLEVSCPGTKAVLEDSHQ